MWSKSAMPPAPRPGVDEAAFDDAVRRRRRAPAAGDVASAAARRARRGGSPTGRRCARRRALSRARRDGDARAGPSSSAPLPPSASSATAATQRGSAAAAAGLCRAQSRGATTVAAGRRAVRRRGGLRAAHPAPAGRDGARRAAPALDVVGRDEVAPPGAPRRGRRAPARSRRAGRCRRTGRATARRAGDAHRVVETRSSTDARGKCPAAEHVCASMHRTAAPAAAGCRPGPASAARRSPPRRAARVADLDLQQEAVELRLRQRVGASVSIGFCVASTMKGRCSAQRLAFERDLVFLHDFEQRALRLGRRAVDLVGQQNVGEYRSAPHAQAGTRPMPGGGGSSTAWPVMSEGIMSGVNWMRA